MNLASILVALILATAAYVFKKIRYWRSNVPSPGLFWFRKANNKNALDLKNYIIDHKLRAVHAFYVPKTTNWLNVWWNFNSAVFVAHPDLAQIVLKDEETYAKSIDIISDLRYLLVDSILMQNGEEWRSSRDILGPAFHYDYVKQMVPIFTGRAKELFDLWRENGEELNMREQMGHFTVDCLGLAAFNIDFKAIHGGTHEYLQAYKYLVKIDASKSPADIAKAVGDLTKMTKEIIASKENKGEITEEKDILDRLLVGKDKLTDEQMRNNIFLMFFAGHETTSNALTWALYYLAKHPEVQRRAREEVEEAFNGTIPDAESIKKLTYLDWVIKEVLRLRPSVANLITRKSTKDSYLGEFFIPKGTAVGVNIQTIHHLEEFWEQPNKFDPERFSPANSEHRHPFQYLPFSLGRRFCMGNLFSIMEQKLFLSMALQRFTLEIHENCRDEPIQHWRECWPQQIILNAISRNGSDQLLFPATNICDERV